MLDQFLKKRLQLEPIYSNLSGCIYKKVFIIQVIYFEFLSSFNNIDNLFVYIIVSFNFQKGDIIQGLNHTNLTLRGTAGGIFLSVLPNLNSEDVFKTVILAAIGAIVSFLLSLVLKLFIKKSDPQFDPCCGDLWVKRIKAKS